MFHRILTAIEIFTTLTTPNRLFGFLALKPVGLVILQRVNRLLIFERLNCSSPIPLPVEADIIDWKR